MRSFLELSKWALEMDPAEGGAFKVPTPTGEVFVIASWALGWDHVSVSRADRCPTWGEMDFIKRAFFRPDEVAMQLHVAEADHINCHPYCLHLWRPQGTKIPLPPKIMVAA